MKFEREEHQTPEGQAYWVFTCRISPSEDVEQFLEVADWVAEKWPSASAASLNLLRVERCSIGHSDGVQIVDSYWEYTACTFDDEEAVLFRMEWC